MPSEPKVKRAAAFFDGQNLFHGAKEAFGYSYPNYDPQKLMDVICREHGWKPESIHFFTGIPDVADNVYWNSFWNRKLAVMGTRGIHTFSRPLRYRNQCFKCPDGQTVYHLIGQEKGIDIRIALDIVRLAREGYYDVAVVFSQDQDLSEVADEVRAISMLKDRWIKIVSAFPVSPTSNNRRGINGTDWIKIDKNTYDACIDPLDYNISTNP